MTDEFRPASPRYGIGKQPPTRGPGYSIARNATGATLGLQPSSTGASATTVGLHLQGRNAKAVASQRRLATHPDRPEIPS